jgi:hypothetical protein
MFFENVGNFIAQNSDLKGSGVFYRVKTSQMTGDRINQRDEQYVLNLRDAVLGLTRLSQYRFDFLRSGGRKLRLKAGITASCVPTSP